MAEEIIGNYRLLAEIGRGGMGIIYRAEQMNLGRVIALKVLYPHLVADPIVVKRFTNEARAAALVPPENYIRRLVEVCETLDYGREPLFQQRPIAIRGSRH